MSRVLPLLAVGAADRPRVGGKAWHLAQLARHGLPVPRAVVVTTDAFSAALDEAGLAGLAESARARPAEAADLREALLEMAPPPWLAAALAEALGSFAGPFAVRSSAVGEDGRDASFAGQHLTELGVGASGVAAAVVRCWASMYAPAAMSYRRQRGPDPGAMAVLVQRLVEPQVSGVLFTVNPLSGSWREMTVEATFGLGEPLVAGEVTPHWFLVRRPRRAPRPVQRVLSRVRLSVVQQDLPEIALRAVARGGETVREPLPADLVGRPALDRAGLFRVCRLGLRAEALLGEPQDVEWAIDGAGVLHLLQARPITRGAAPRPRAGVLWTRRFIGERWPEPATPLGWSLIAPVLEHFVAYPRTQGRYLGGGPALRLVRSRPYVNVTAFRHLAFKLPGAPAPGFMLELIPPEEEAGWHRRFAALPDLSVYASFLRETVQERRWSRFAFNPIRNPAQWEAFRDRLDEALPALSAAPVSLPDAVRQVEAQQRWVTEYVGIHLCSLLFANLSYQLLEAALAEWVPEEAAALMRDLATCPPGNRTLEANAALWHLAELATADDLDALERGAPPRPAFAGPLHAFLDRYGHRSAASWELFTPRWADEPARLAPMLRAFAGGELSHPERRAEDQEAAHARALARAREAVGGGRRVLLEGLVHYARRYLLLRENQRFAFDRLLFAERRTLLWIGARLAERGWLDAAADVAFLTWDELVGLCGEALPPGPAREWVARRRARREEDLGATPPVFLRGDEDVVALPSGARLQGLGISPGRARGRVRIVRSPAEAASVPDGAVIVAHAVDPGWTPLFGKASAVVLELGSRLSHGAVVAREYGLPAVVNLDGVTRTLRDGQEVTVDGTRGVVWLHP